MPDQKQRKTTRRQEIKRSIKSVESKAKAKRSWFGRVEDKIVSTFGTAEFLLFNLLFFAGWVAVNSDLIPAIEPFDPFPYILLITIVSIEAIILAIFVLITQNRQARINSLREETELHVNLISEQEITKVLKVLAIILKKMGVDPTSDPELQKMIEPLNPEEVEKQLEEQLDGN